MNRSRTALTAYALAGLMTLSAHFVFAQSPSPLPNPDLSGFLTGGIVHATVEQADGGIIIGGLFSSVDGEPRNSLARLLPDRTLDPTWKPSVDSGGIVYALAVDADGSILVGGSFESIDSTNRQSLAKVSGTGSGTVDPDWDPSVFLGSVQVLVVDDMGSLYVGGFFDDVGGTPRSNLARVSLAGTGSVDNWDPSPSHGVYALVADDAGAVYVGGLFSSIGGQTRNLIAKVSTSGTGQADANWNASATGYAVGGIDLDETGDLFVGGEFSQMGGLSRNHLAKLAAGGNGVADPIWNPLPDGIVYKVQLDGIGGLAVAGEFRSINAQSRFHFARLSTSATGTVDSNWNPASDQSGRSIHLLDDGDLLVGGWFDYMGDAPRLSLATISATGTVGGLVDVELGGGYPSVALALADGGTVVGGRFSKVNGVARQRLLRLQPNGSLDPDWHPMAGGGFDGENVNALAEGNDGAIYVAGDFTMIDGTPRASIARIDAEGHLDPGWNPAPDGSVNDLVIDSANSSLYVSGGFSAIGGAARSRLAKLSLAGTGQADALWNPGPDAPVSALALDAPSSLYVAGVFTMIGGQSRAGLAKLSANGTGSATPGWNPGVNNYIDSLTVDGNGDVYAAGAFTNLGGLPRNHIARVSPTGAVDAAWNPSANARVSTLALRGDSLYAGGDFTSIGGGLHSRLARLSKSGPGVASVAWDPSPNSRATGIATDATGPIRVVGLFTTIAGQARTFLAALPPTSVAIEITSESSYVQAGDLLTYRIALDNSAPNAVPGVGLSADLPPELPLAGMSWTCAAGAGSSCGAMGTSGNGMLPESVDLGSQGAIEFLYQGVVTAGTSDALRVTVTATTNGEPLSATVGTVLGIFRNGFDPDL